MYEYTEEQFASLKKVEATRKERLTAVFPLLSENERLEILKNHPDNAETGYKTLKLGVNEGDRIPCELADILCGKPRVTEYNIDLNAPEIDTDVLVIGGGGAGIAAAIEAEKVGVKVTVVTKFRVGDSNTIMAEGGMQAATGENDSPAIHFLDLYGGSGYTADAGLLKKLTLNAPEAIRWLEELGVNFDKAENGDMITTSGGGVCRKRLHACKDFTGLEIMRTLRSEALSRDINFVEYASAIEIVKDEKGNASGAIICEGEKKKAFFARAKTVIIATGGAGRLHYNGFPTSNHFGSTADGLAIAYRAGARLVNADSEQYHPTGVALPESNRGSLVTEKCRALGAGIVDKNGEMFINSLEKRDVTTSAIINVCKNLGKGVRTEKGFGVWLDLPMIDMINGDGTIEKRLPSTLKKFLNYGIDVRKEPILVYPTLHYQNGGIKINENCETTVENLYAAGEAAGGIHGRNRLMGNSLLDIIVFGREAGRRAAEKSKTVKAGKPTLSHVENYMEKLKRTGAENGELSPALLPRNL